MNLMQLINKRCSVRNYSDTPVEKEKIEYLLEAARLAPSATNAQPWKFLLITSPEQLGKVYSCYPREWIKNAPACIIIYVDHAQSWKRASDGKDHADIDAAIAAEHICLAAAEQDLGSCWVCNFNTELCRELFPQNETLEPVIWIPFGYPKDPEVFTNTPKKRKKLDEIIERY